MIRIESTNPATSLNVNGIAFAPHPDPERRATSKVSALVDEAVADRFCAIPGYSRCGALSPSDEAALEAALAKQAASAVHQTASKAEQTVDELKRANRALADERDTLRKQVGELQRAGVPEASKTLSAEVSRLTTEVQRLTTERDTAAAERDAATAEVTRLTGELAAAKAPPADGSESKDDKNKGGKNK